MTKSNTKKELGTLEYEELQQKHVPSIQVLEQEELGMFQGDEFTMHAGYTRLEFLT